MKFNELINKVKWLWKTVIELIRFYCSYPLAKLLYGGRDIWLVSENGATARDNGYHFFKYLRENHPEIESYYVIPKDSADYMRVKSYGSVVHYKSFKHYCLFIASKVQLSTQIMGCSTDYPIYWWLVRKKKKWLLFSLKAKQIFLQHGVIKDAMPQFYKENTDVDIFICGAKPEYDYICETYHYDNEVKYTGLARFDNLHNQVSKKQILVMPTWRNWLIHGTENGNEKKIAQSNYIKTWNAFLNSQELDSLLEETNINLIFYPHFAIQKYIRLFSTMNRHVKIADINHFDVQQLLKESALLITDYSSVYFDFAYMRKPVIYYQFDREEYRAKHYGNGYFDYDTMGFGEVAQKEEQLIRYMKNYIESDFKLRERYAIRSAQFFPLHDMKNCERIYQEVIKLL